MTATRTAYRALLVAIRRTRPDAGRSQLLLAAAEIARVLRMPSRADEHLNDATLTGRNAVSP